MNLISHTTFGISEKIALLWKRFLDDKLVTFKSISFVALSFFENFPSLIYVHCTFIYDELYRILERRWVKGGFKIYMILWEKRHFIS